MAGAAEGGGAAVGAAEGEGDVERGGVGGDGLGAEVCCGEGRGAAGRVLSGFDAVADYV